jgi:putative membrane protein
MNEPIDTHAELDADSAGRDARVADAVDGVAAPDPRLTFANERTFLAWSRTALALIAGGLAVSQLVRVKSGGAQFALALALIGFGAFIAYTGYRHWQRNERALRIGQPVQPSALPLFLAGGVTGFALAAAGLALLRLLT